MRPESRPASPQIITPTVAWWLAFGWMAALAGVWLIQFNAWLFPFQFANLASASLPKLTIGPHFGAFVGLCVADITCVTLIVATAFALGALATARLVIERDWFSALLTLALGLWMVAVLTLAVGALTTSKVPLILLGALAWLAPAPRRWLTWRPGPGVTMDGWNWLLLAVIVFAALANLPGAFAPPFEYDELEYHLGALAEYQRAGHITFLPHNFYSDLPQLTEMLYLLAWTTSSDIAAKLLHWLFGVLTAMAIYAVAARLWSRRIALTAAALFYCVPFVQDLGQTARIDLATTFFATLAFGALLVWRKDADGAAKSDDRWLWIAALMAGGAVATKWTAIAVVALPAFLFVAATTKSLRRTSVFCLLSSVFAVPWLAKNWLLAGNPVYPLFHNLWLSPHWSAEQAAMFAAKHGPTFGTNTLAEFFQRAWQYSFAEPGAVPLLLMTVPLVLLARHREPVVRCAAWLFVAAYAGWFGLTFRPWRFVLPALPLAAMLGAWALEQIGEARPALLRGVVGLVLLVSLARLALGDLVDMENPEKIPPRSSFLQFTLGQQSPDEFQSRMGGGVFEPVVWMNEHLPTTAKVMYVGEGRVALAQHGVVWASAFDQFPTAMTNGVTHVYINASELQRLHKNYDYPRAMDVTALMRNLGSRAKEIHRMNGSVVYELLHDP